MPAKKTPPPASRWVVVVSVTDPVTGAQVARQPHECRDMCHARTLLTELRELAAELAEYLPGLSVEGYETGEAFSLTPQGQTALETLAEEAATGRVYCARS